MILICLTKGSKLFENVKFNSNEDLVTNKNVILIGSLLLKLYILSSINSMCIMEGSFPCRSNKNLNDCDNERCCEIGIAIVPLPSLINSSCFPNVSRCLTNYNEFFIYVSRPIKKNEQLFNDYVRNYFAKPKPQRQLQEAFNFYCECKASHESWPPLLFIKDEYLNKLNINRAKVE